MAYLLQRAAFDAGEDVRLPDRSVCSGDMTFSYIERDDAMHPS